MPHLLTPSQLAFTHAALLKGNEQIPWLNYRFDFSGKIDIPRLQNSFKDILTIHPILTCEFSANYKELVEAPYQDDFADFITIVNSEDEIPDLPSNKKLTQLY